MKILSLFLISFAASVWAQGVDWDKRFEELCTYDVDFCGNLKDSNGNWKRPKAEMVMALKELAPVINKAARDFGVDPRAIAGSILAENSLNVSISDDIQDWLVKMKIAGDGDLLGKQFSFGWGQLYMDAAMEAEPLMAKIENRKVRTAEEVAEALLKPEESIRYVAAVVKTIQKNYAKEGYDISDKPEILTTVYNLGGSSRRAKQARRANREPRVNYFGFFVEKNIDVLEGIVSPEVSVKKLQNQKFWDFYNKEPEGAIDKILSYFEPDDTRPKELGRRATSEIILQHAPPTCVLGGNDTDREYVQNTSYKESKPSGTLQFEEGMREITTYLDCDLNEWKLVENEAGDKTGWVSLDNLLESSRPSNVLKLCEDSKKTKACYDRLRFVPSLKILSTRDGSVEVKLAGKKEEINWKKPFVSEWCSEKVNNQPQANQKVLNQAEIDQLQTAVKAWKKSVCQTIGNFDEERGEDHCFNQDENPYRFLENSLRFHTINSCSLLPDIKANKYQCRGDAKEYLARLAKIPIKKSPGWDDIKATIEATDGMHEIINHIYSNQIPSIKGAPDPQDILDQIRDNINYCIEIAQNYPKALEVLQNKLLELDDPTMHNNFIANQFVFRELEKQCEELRVIYVGKSDDEQSEDECWDCTTSMNVYLPSGSQNFANSQFLSKKMIESMLQDDEQKDSFLMDQIELQFLNISSGGGFGSMQYSKQEKDSCSYDPKETAKMIEKVFELDCVNDVFVPDPYLLSHFSRKKNSQVPFLKGFVENDRFEINIKARKSCSE